MDSKQARFQEAIRLLRVGKEVADVAEAVGVSRETVYRYVDRMDTAQKTLPSSIERRKVTAYIGADDQPYFSEEDAIVSLLAAGPTPGEIVRGERAERRKQVVELALQQPKLTFREIGRRVGLSSESVRSTLQREWYDGSGLTVGEQRDRRLAGEIIETQQISAPFSADELTNMVKSAAKTRNVELDVEKCAIIVLGLSNIRPKPGPGYPERIAEEIDNWLDLVQQTNEIKPA